MTNISDFFNEQNKEPNLSFGVGWGRSTNSTDFCPNPEFDLMRSSRPKQAFQKKKSKKYCGNISLRANRLVLVGPGNCRSKFRFRLQ